MRLLTKKTTRKVFFKASRKGSPQPCHRRDGRTESCFHWFVTLYSRLSITRPGGGGRRSAAEGHRSLPVRSSPARALPQALASSGPPGPPLAGGAPGGRRRPGRCRRRASRPRPAASPPPPRRGSGRRQRPRRHQSLPHPPWVRGHCSHRYSPRRRRERRGSAGQPPPRRVWRRRCPLGIIPQGRARLPSPPPSRLYTHTIDPASLPHIRGLYADPAEAFRLPPPGARRARPAALFT